jgi:hypothetical protein
MKRLGSTEVARTGSVGNAGIGKDAAGASPQRKGRYASRWSQAQVDRPVTTPENAGVRSMDGRGDL